MKRSSVQGDEKVSSGPLSLQKGSNFNTMPANLAKVHLQKVDYPSHTLSLRRDKGAAKGISTELPGAKSIYICDSELFKQLDGDAARGSGEGGVLLPGPASATLKPAKGKEEAAKYSLSLEQPAQTRLLHLAGSSSEPTAAFALKSLPSDQVGVACSDKDSPPQHLQNLPREPKGAGGACEAPEAGMTKSETVSTLSMSSLEVRHLCPNTLA